LEGEIGKLFHFEIKDGIGPEKYWGRWGLFTHESWGLPEAKPRYQALLFLNRMSGNKVNVAGEGSWVKAFAKEEKGIIKLFIVNYDPWGKNNETVPLTFNNLPWTTFFYQRINYGGGGKDKIQISPGGTSWQTVENFKPNSAAIIILSP